VSNRKVTKASWKALRLWQSDSSSLWRSEFAFPGPNIAYCVSLMRVHCAVIARALEGDGLAEALRITMRADFFSNICGARKTKTGVVM